MTTWNVKDEESRNVDQLNQEEKGPEPGSSSSSSHNPTREVDLDVLNGFQSFMLVFAVSLAGFVYTLDINIIVTVSLLGSL